MEYFDAYSLAGEVELAEVGASPRLRDCGGFCGPL